MLTATSRPCPATLTSLALLVILGLGAPGLASAETGASPAAGCGEGLNALYERVSPAVVAIAATSINPFRLAERVSRSAGSGFIIDPAGVVVTNAHVVFGRQSITVTLDDGTRLPGRLVGADPIFDVALLQIPSPTQRKLPTAVLGDSDALRVGDEVLAIGNPLGLEQTLTRGIVSALNRVLSETPFSAQEPLIQTDAPINPGNSGGPLLNRCGQVVGITAAMIAEAQNIGFAIPINLVKAIVPSLTAHGRVIRPWLGFHGQLIGQELKHLLRMPLADGLLVEAVEPESPAAANGIRGGDLELVVDGQSLLLGGDIVTVMNGVRLDSQKRLSRVMRDLKVGDTVRLTVFRDGATRAVEYRLVERPLLPSDLAMGRPVLPLRRPWRAAPGLRPDAAGPDEVPPPAPPAPALPR